MPPTTAEPTFRYDLFISYSTQNAAWVRGELLTRLDAAGIKTFIEFRDFQLGAPIITEIERGIMTSRKALLVLTPTYLASNWTEFETLLLQTLDPANRTLRLLPLLKERCDLLIRIRFLTYADFINPAEHDLAWRKLFTRLGATPPLVSSMQPVNPLSTSLCATPSPAAIRQLRTVLAHLYPDKTSATRIARDAGLPVAMLPLGDRPIDHWHAILRKAQKHNQLMALLDIVYDEYGANQDWAATIRSMQA